VKVEHPQVLTYKFQIVLNTVRIHALKTLFHFFLCISKSLKYRQNAPFTALVVKMCLAVLNRFKYCQNAPFTVLVFIFSAVPNRFKSVTMHTLETLFSIFTQQFQIVSNAVRMHA